jgi:hypothetical protein
VQGSDGLNRLCSRVIFYTAKLTPSQLIFAPHFDHYFVGDITDLPPELLLYYEDAPQSTDPPSSSSSAFHGTESLHTTSASAATSSSSTTTATGVPLKLDKTLTQRRVITGLKNLLGYTTIAQIKEKYPDFPYQLDVIPNENAPDGKELMVVCEDTLGHMRRYTVIELVSFVLLYLRQCAIDYLKAKPIAGVTGEEYEGLNRVVLGIPAHFPETKKEALKQAAFMAGFDEVSGY